MNELIIVCRELINQIKELRARVHGRDYASNDAIDSISAVLDSLDTPAVPEGEQSEVNNG